MDETPAIPGFLSELFRAASAELLQLCAAAVEQASAQVSDFHSLRDFLDIAEYDSEPLHVLLLLLILAQREGSLCLELTADNLTRRLSDLVGQEQVAGWTQRILRELEQNQFERLIGAAADADRPIIRRDIEGRRLLYFQKFLRHEEELTAAIIARLYVGQDSNPARAERGQDWNPAPHDAVRRAVLIDQPLRFGGQPMELDPDQRRALDLALSRNLVLISGGPGTGKTSLVLTLLRCLIRLGHSPERIALAAPTGRAAQRLGDALRQGLATLPVLDAHDQLLAELNPSTLHSLLEYLPHRDQFRRHLENPIPADVVIVDEVSMVGLVLMTRLFEALAPETKLVLLGDKDQLPSVDAGAVLANLVPEEPSSATGGLADCVVMLRTNHRSEPHIRAAAQEINDRRTDMVDALPRLDPAGSWAELTGCRLLEQTKKTPAEMRRILDRWAEHAYLGTDSPKLLESFVLPDVEDGAPGLLAALFAILERTRLLTLVREGPWGCEEINRYLDRILRPRLDRTNRGPLFAGAPVLITRNDRQRQLNNGDVGLTVRGPRGSLRVVFPRQGGFVSFPADALPSFELGFALTVHKSQGSEYGQVLLVLPPEGGRRLLTKELIYTGITRAKELAMICATPEALRFAIGRRCEREAGLLRTIGQSARGAV